MNTSGKNAPARVISIGHVAIPSQLQDAMSRVGLAWVFLRAGSHNVIAALWQVADVSSPLLMDRLYDELQAGKAPDAALRSAKLSLIHSSGAYRRPLFWGAYQLYAGS